MKLENLIALFVLSLASLLPSTSHAEPQELRLERIIHAATTYHPLIKASEADTEAAAGELLAAQGNFDLLAQAEMTQYASGAYDGTYYDTKIIKPLEFLGSTLIGGYREGSGQFPSYDDYYITDRDGEIRAGIEIPLLRNRATDKRRTQIAKSLYGNDIAKLSLDLRRLELARLAAFTYWEWVAARDKHRIYGKLLTVAQQRDTQLRKRDEAGDIARMDRVDNERQLLQRETQLLQAMRAIKKAEYDLSLFFRDTSGQMLSLEPYIPPTNHHELIIPQLTATPDSVIEGAYLLRPDLARIEGQLRQQELDKVQAENELLPKLDLKNYVSQEYGTAASKKDDVEYRVGLALEVPLQTRAQRGRINVHTAKINELTAQKTALRDKIKTDMLDALNALEIAKKRCLIARREHKIALELEEGERVKFSHGDSNLIFVNLREQTTADAAVREVDTILDFNRALAQYYAVRGVIPSEKQGAL
jgi:cobalt-zinc-cadmium efflux system outer membrane protein